MTITSPGLAKLLKAEAGRLGFVSCGITQADVGAEQGARLAGWLALGSHGDMGWMETRADERAHPQALWPEALSVIMLGMSYAPHADPLALATEPERGRISVYAQGRDYHDVMKKALKALARWLLAEGGGALKVFVDTAPVMEKPLAARAGIGWQGKHSNVVSRAHGSWLFLGAIMTTLDLAADAPHPDLCGTCTACQSACPTDAFPTPYTLDARRCISYLTIEHNGPIPHEFRRAVGNRIYGCDDCLAVCPWNRFASAALANAAFAPRPSMNGPALAELLALDDAAFRARFSGSPVKRIGRDRLVRNACIAAGNSGALTLHSPLQALAGDANEFVAEAAHWALGELDAL